MNLSPQQLSYSYLRKLSPAQFLVIAYIVVLLAGTFLLRLPAANPGQPLRFIDALFMASSALCVTGLAVIPIGSELTLFGQLVILALIQIGALGVMTMSTLFALFLGRKIGLKNRMFLQEDLNQNYLSGVVRLVRYVLFVTLVIESTGAFILFLLWVGDMPMGQALYNAVFHSVSAFANAGFDLFGTSFEGFAHQGMVILTIAFLFILGGLGFSVIYELWQYRNQRVFSLHTKLVLAATTCLLLVAWITILALEFDNPLTVGEFPLAEKLVMTFFTGATPRTAGFNVVPTANLSISSLFFILFLMFVGASPGSTGGGIKTTTFVVMLLGAWSTIVGKRDVEVTNRRIAHSQLEKAWTIFFLSLTWLVVVTMILLVIEDFEFMEILFEAVSAFGTVGLSMGITSELSDLGKGLIAVTMFIGRLGPMTLALALGQRGLVNSHVRLPEEKVSLG